MARAGAGTADPLPPVEKGGPSLTRRKPGRGTRAAPLRPAASLVDVDPRHLSDAVDDVRLHVRDDLLLPALERLEEGDTRGGAKVVAPHEHRAQAGPQLHGVRDRAEAELAGAVVPDVEVPHGEVPWERLAERQQPLVSELVVREVEDLQGRREGDQLLQRRGRKARKPVAAQVEALQREGSVARQPVVHKRLQLLVRHRVLAEEDLAQAGVVAQHAAEVHRRVTLAARVYERVLEVDRLEGAVLPQGDGEADEPLLLHFDAAELEDLKRLVDLECLAEREGAGLFDRVPIQVEDLQAAPSAALRAQRLGELRRTVRADAVPREVEVLERLVPLQEARERPRARVVDEVVGEVDGLDLAALRQGLGQGKELHELHAVIEEVVTAASEVYEEQRLAKFYCFVQLRHNGSNKITKEVFAFCNVSLLDVLCHIVF
mmetsp:Transcript_22738/g.54432  ORF Transcript_22738/g.54432 Transcript_22738/m.54432 type:complete len:432 (+) Transcript_22738:182-1477(+)